MIQAISVASKKRFHTGKQADAAEFLSCFLHQLHTGVGGSMKKSGSSIINETFQGLIEVTTRQKKRNVKKRKAEEEDDREGSDNEEERKANEESQHAKQKEEIVIEDTTMTTQFLHLTLDVPEKPLFKDDDGGLVIPQEPLVTVLQKFNGISFSDAISRQGTPQRRRYRLKKLPNYLILHLARFKKNDFYVEKNPTIVAFPVRNLDLSSYIHRDNDEVSFPTEEDVRSMNVRPTLA